MDDITSDVRRLGDRVDRAEEEIASLRDTRHSHGNALAKHQLEIELLKLGTIAEHRAFDSRVAEAEADIKLIGEEVRAVKDRVQSLETKGAVSESKQGWIIAVAVFVLNVLLAIAFKFL